jgi:hypothetical protein
MDIQFLETSQFFLPPQIVVDRSTKAISKIELWLKLKAGPKFQPAGILKYFEELKRGPNAEIGPKGIFEIASNSSCP